jgi:hypothetical protein
MGPGVGGLPGDVFFKILPVAPLWPTGLPASEAAVSAMVRTPDLLC